MHLLCLLGSSRPGGNSEWLARQALAALPAGVTAEVIPLRERRIEPVVDCRHNGRPWPLTTTVTTPLYGKLADLFGRKRTLVAGPSSATALTWRSGPDTRGF